MSRSPGVRYCSVVNRDGPADYTIVTHPDGLVMQPRVAQDDQAVLATYRSLCVRSFFRCHLHSSDAKSEKQPSLNVGTSACGIVWGRSRHFVKI